MCRQPDSLSVMQGEQINIEAALAALWCDAVRSERQQAAARQRGVFVCGRVARQVYLL